MLQLFKNKLHWILQEQKIILYGFLSLAVIVVIKTIWFKPNQDVKTVQETIQVDTLIPLGHVLIPIQIQNFEAASALLGGAGIVDLWSFDPVTHRKSKKVASRLKMIRAPLNPQMYAVLVPETESEKILMHGDTFLITVQSDRSNSPEVLSEKKISRQTIETYELKE